MAYFLKKTNNKKGIYLQIYESYYDSERKGGAHRSYKPIGYVHELQANGIEDPISFFGEEVQKLNQEHKKKKQVEKRRQISDESPEKQQKQQKLVDLKSQNHWDRRKVLIWIL